MAPLRRPVLLLAFALVAAAVCVRLGIWQLARLEQRLARNAVASERLALPPVELKDVPSDTAALRFRRIRASGVFDYEHELARAFQSRKGSPGVHLVTPLRRTATDTAVLVIRGWVYTPDAKVVDFAYWRERDSASIEGYVLPFASAAPEPDSVAGAPRAFRQFDRARLAARVGSPLAEYYVVMTSGGAAADSTPSRLGDPVLTDGPHLSYAVQWFLFATIFGAGGTVVILRSRRTSPEGGQS